MKIKIWFLSFIVALAFAVGVGIFSIYRGFDTIKNGEEALLKYSEISNIYSHHKKSGKLYFRWQKVLNSPYKNDISHINEKIADNKKRCPKGWSVDVKQNFILTLERDSKGVLKVADYGMEIPQTSMFCYAYGFSCAYAEGKGEKYRELDVPYISFHLKNCSETLSFSKSEMENLEKYINKLPKNKRETYLKVRFKDGMFIIVDAIVNGVSLNSVARGEKVGTLAVPSKK